MIINKAIFFIVVLTLIYSYCESAAYSDRLDNKYFDNNKQRTYDKNGNHEISGVAGKRASIKNYPYTAAVIARTVSKGSAAILNKLWLLTSITAIAGETPEYVVVRAGSDVTVVGGQTRWASKIIEHPDQYKWRKDVALIKLKTPLKFNNQVKSIKLPNNSPKKGAKGSLSGFGYYVTNDSSNANDKKFTGKDHDGWLRATTLDILTYEECKSYYSEYDYFTNSSFCTKPRTDIGPAFADYGSPLVVNKELTGIFCDAYFLLTPTYPPVYTDIHLMKNWIENTIRDNSDPKELLDISNDIQYYK